MIKATIIAHSVSEAGNPIITYELEYPRFIHAELMTHRLFSRNAASSRAIPVETIIDMVKNNPAMPVHWGANQSGMQAKTELSGANRMYAREEWLYAARAAATTAKRMVEIGLHKQVANRILEPFQLMKTVVTATEFDNFFWLRNHPDAQPEIHELARIMLEALNASTPKVLHPGEWHVPYYWDGFWVEQIDGRDEYGYTLEQALAISSSCCAQVSYRKLDDSLDKAERVYERLVGSVPVHASPFEHQGTPMTQENGLIWVETSGGGYTQYEYGVTGRKVDLNTGELGAGISGNFSYWIQHRQLIPNNVCWDYEE